MIQNNSINLVGNFDTATKFVVTSLLKMSMCPSDSTYFQMFIPTRSRSILFKIFTKSQSGGIY